MLGTDLAGTIDELDVNPLIAGPAGCIALDALVIPKTRRLNSSLTATDDPRAPTT